ncbi:MAG: UDP-N-acetylglucosamine:LPS N-acetylglucosamine transferase [Clostridiales bacterium]|jgi:processive 1,2-diacylglycerol beta-glucosyltransferase|nr:UDP-N-acetylglucosamine:LPS N-acetylglucosamine transferase [Clostridiales bacterium]
MEKKILIISSDFTGHGHKSITTSLCEEFSKHPDVKVHVIDGFSLGGNITLRIGKMYGSVTRNAKELWKLMWDISLRRPDLLNEMTEFMIRDAFLKILKSVQPDLILSVHPNFNGSILNILKEYKIDIPFVTLIADLVSITPLWTDPRVDYILCPTIESKYKAIEFGVPEARTKIIDFPIRSRFCKIANDDTAQKDNSYTLDRPLECLIMSGGEGSGNMSTVAKILLKNFNCNIKIVSGRNHILKRRLENTLLEKYSDRVKIYGFVEDIQDLMASSDIAFTRGSPNTALEAVMCNVPLIVTGALPGQEEGNPGYLQKNNLAVICKDVRKLKSVINELLSDGAKKLNEIKKSQKEFRNPNVAQEIVDFLLEIDGRGKFIIPDATNRFFKLKTPKPLSLRRHRRY